MTQLALICGICSIAVLVGCTGIVGDGALKAGAGGADSPSLPLDPGAKQTGGTEGSTRPGEPLAEFECDPGQKGALPRRLWRLGGSQYMNAVSVFLGGRGSVGSRDKRLAAFTAPFDFRADSDRFSTFAASYTMANFEFDRLVKTSGDAAALLTASLRADPNSCLGSAIKTPFAKCIESLIVTRGPLLFQRPLSPDETSTYASAATDSVALLGEDEAANLAFQSMLASPTFVYRTELGQPGANATEVRLTQFEIAAALAYTLTAWPPTTALYEAASQGLLATPEQVAAQTRLLMGSEGQAPPALSNFLREYFRSRGLEKVFKNNADLNTDNRAALIEDFDTLITDIVASSATKDFFSAVLTTKKVRYRTQTAALYGQNDPHERVSFSTAMLENRAGLLTHPAWLASLSSDTETHPVARGKFISESFLCRPLPPLPVGMIPVLSDDPKRTMREKLAIHGADPKCAACHQFMDPLGLVFEAYDQNGRPRTIDKGGKAVDSTGALSGAGQQDGPLTGPVDLAQRLAASPVVQECMVRHSFRYWMGHDEAPYDGCTLAAAKTAYDANGGSYIHLVASLFSSRSFLNRSTR